MNIGDKLPEILGVDQNGQEVRTSEYAGRKVILYFYPKDQTPGCTAEACSLRDNYSELTQMGYEVIGVSADSAESHQKFIAAHELPFRLIADTDKTLINAMGVWGEKNRYGKSRLDSCALPSSSTKKERWKASSPLVRFAPKSTLHKLLSA